VVSLAATLDGTRIAAGLADGHVLLMDPDGKVIMTFDFGAIYGLITTEANVFFDEKRGRLYASGVGVECFDLRVSKRLFHVDYPGRIENPTVLPDGRILFVDGHRRNRLGVLSWKEDK
jgi:hypothetical protein